MSFSLAGPLLVIKAYKDSKTANFAVFFACVMRSGMIVEIFNKRNFSMATVNFSVPDEVKEAFNRAFAKQNKSAIIAELMQKAVQEQQRQDKRAIAIKQLTERRKLRRLVTAEEIRAAREALRS
jgi:hypothetical protein